MFYVEEDVCVIKVFKKAACLYVDGSDPEEREKFVQERGLE